MPLIENKKIKNKKKKKKKNLHKTKYIYITPNVYIKNRKSI